jgi:hypothetical protein
MSNLEDYVVKIEEAKCVLKNGETVLDVPVLRDEELPYVSIVTITRDRKKLFPITIQTFEAFNISKFC